MRIAVIFSSLLVAALPALPNTITVNVSNVTSTARAIAGSCSQTAAYTAAVNCSNATSTLDAGADLLGGNGVASGIGLYADSLPVNTMQPVVASGQASFQELFSLTGGPGGDFLFIPYSLQVDNGSDVFDGNFGLGSASYELTASSTSVFETYVNYGNVYSFMISLNTTTPSDPHHTSTGHSGADIAFGTPYLSSNPNATWGQPLNGTLFPAPVPEPGTWWLLPLGIAAIGIARKLRSDSSPTCSEKI